MSATLGARPPKAAASRQKSGEVRADIQALRAIAVAFVVAYHFFPVEFAGGFVGVDVFFVISGFLITSHLLSKPPRSGRDLAEFWGGRVRRLLPASFVVLLVSLAGTLAFAPITVWRDAAEQTIASVFYVENWFLAAETVDYLAEYNEPSAAQHFWSLAIEEQFYLVWPIVVLIAVAWAIRRGREQRAAVTVAISAIVLASFIASILITGRSEAEAYFVSWTRAWELGIGGLAACIFPWAQRFLGERTGLRTILAYLGLVGIFVTGFSYSRDLPFPGWIALLPVVSTAVVILATVTPGRLSPLPVLAWRPIQLTGDLSYSIYLWHWPAAVLLPYALGHSLPLWGRVVAIIGVFGLSWLTKLWVEDRFRSRMVFGEPLRRTYLFGLSGMLVIAALSLAVIGAVTATEQAEKDRAEQEVAAEVAAPTPDCVASRALVNSDECDPHGEELLTTPVAASADQPAPYEDGCWILDDLDEQKTCTYGSDDPNARKVALVGNSNAGHWLPALQDIAAEENWNITTYLIVDCYTVEVPLQLANPAQSANCLTWNERVVDEVAHEQYDLVVFSNRTASPFEGMTMAETREAAPAAYGEVLQTWSEADVPVLVLRDVPRAGEIRSIPDCVEENLDNVAACDGTRERIPDDPLAVAARGRIAAGDTSVAVLDLTDRFCAGETCYSVIGGVIAYFDRGHMTTTFARSLVPDLQPAADALLASSE